MIKGLTPNIAPALEKGNRSDSLSSSGAKKTEKADFADQLFGAKSGKLEGPETRNERKDQPGRASEGKRSVTREKTETESRSADTRPRPDGEKVERKPAQAAKKSSSKPEPRETESPMGTAQYREPIAEQRPVKAETVETPSETSTIESTEGSTLQAKAAPSKGVPTQGVPTQPAKAPVMPDFFSKTALAGGAGIAAPVVAQDPAAVQAGTTAEMLMSMQAQEATARQEAMAQFLTQMEQELGVPPEKILQAFSEMDLDSLAATPQNSVGAFVEGLDLEPAGQVRAAELYKNLLDKRGDAIAGEKLASLGEDVKIAVSSPRDVALKKLDKSLTDLNAAFFRKDGGLAQNPEKAQMAVENMDAQIAKLMRERGDNSAKRDQSEIALMGAGAVSGVFAAEAMDGGEAASMASDSVSSFSRMTSSIGDLPAMPKTPDFGGGQSSNEQMSGGNQQNGQANTPVVNATSKNVDFKDSVTKEMKTVDKETTSLRGEKLATEAASPASVGGPAAGQAPASKAPLAAGATMMMGRQATPADEQQNIREMVRQAQVMLKRGGGEMKLEMTPEGMGQVHLKVAVENGQVSVQMLTESESAKRLIEKGLGDLKTSMAAHQLKVENVRVDVGQDIQKHMDQQAGQEQARNFAREFMQQQREERQGMRDGAFAMRGIGSYGGNKRAPLEPETVQGASARASAARSSGRGLNLVA